MIEVIMSKSFVVWLDVSIALWAIIYHKDILAVFKDLFGGYAGKKPKDKDETPKEDK